MADNIITAVFGATRETKVRPRYRYDVGQILVVKGVPNLPDFYEVHFANEGSTADATPLIGTAEGVEIPGAYFQSGATIYAYIYVHDEATDGTTVYKVTIPIINRARPANIEPTQEQEDIIAQAIIALNENVGRAEDAAEQAEASAESVEAAADGVEALTARAEAAAQAAEASETNASSSATTAQSAAQSAAGSASDAADYMGAAAEMASNATTAASRASSRADAAASYASQAQQSANSAASAKTDAQTARTQAQGYRQAAEAAATRAESAATRAETALAAAETAQSAAEAAQTAAEAAETDTQTYAGQASQSAANAAQSAASAAQTLAQVQAEGASQIAAIDAEGQRVIDSIPEDYTEVVSDVADLKSQTTTIIKGSNFLCPSAIYAPNGESLYGANRALSTPPDNAVCIKLASDIQVALYGYKHLDYLGCWNGTNGFVTTATWMSGVIDLKAIYSMFPDCNFKLVFRYTNNQNITNVSDIEGKTTFICAENYERENSFFYAHPSTRYTSALTIINGKLYGFKFTSSNDNVAEDYSVYALSKGFISRMKNNSIGKSNFGHNNCVDYSHKNGYLLTSNGGNSSNTNPSKIYLFANAKTIAESLSDFDVNSSDCVTIDVSQDGRFGKQVNAVWGEPNLGRYDLIFVMSNYEVGNMAAFEENNVCDYTGNSIRFLHVVQLGQGTNQLESGVYTAKSDGEFNGTYKVIDSYTYDFAISEAVNDAQYYHGHLYINTNSSKSKILDLTIKNGNVDKRVIAMTATNVSGAKISSEGEGLAISDDGYVYYTYYSFNICSFDNLE